MDEMPWLECQSQGESYELVEWVGTYLDGSIYLEYCLNTMVGYSYDTKNDQWTSDKIQSTDRKSDIPAEQDRWIVNGSLVTN